VEGELKLRDKVVDVLHVPMLKTGGFCGGHPMSFGLGADARRPPWGAGVDARSDQPVEEIRSAVLPGWAISHWPDLATFAGRARLAARRPRVQCWLYGGVVFGGPLIAGFFGLNALRNGLQRSWGCGLIAGAFAVVPLCIWSPTCR
jgi:hypothetical protein